MRQTWKGKTPQNNSGADKLRVFANSCLSFFGSRLSVVKQTFYKTGGNLRRRYKCVYAPWFIFCAVSFFLQILSVEKSKDKKTVLVMIDSLSGGGAERVATILASALSGDYNVALLSVKEDSPRYPIDAKVKLLLMRQILRDGIQINNGVRKRVLKLLIRYLKKRLRVDVSISFLYEMNYLNVSSKVSDKVVCCERNNPFKGPRDSLRVEQIKSIYEQADHVVFQTEYVRSLFSDSIKEHSSILHNPISVACERKTVVKKRIVNLGRLVPQKNQAMLIRAFKRFHDLHPDYTLSIYGKTSGDDYYLTPKLRTLVKTLNLQEAVLIEGRSWQIHQDIADAEFFVLSSDFEGYSNALLEAMTMGFPCISTDCEGSVEVVKNGVNGLLVPRGDEDALLKAMLTFAEQADFRERLGKEAKKTSERFRQERVVQEWEEMIERI